MGKKETKKGLDFSYIAKIAEPLANSSRMDESTVLDILQTLKNTTTAAVKDFDEKKSYWAVYAKDVVGNQPVLWIHPMGEMSHDAAMECALADDNFRQMEFELVRISEQKYNDLMTLGVWTGVAHVLSELRFSFRRDGKRRLSSEDIHELYITDKMAEEVERKVELLRIKCHLSSNYEIV